MHCDVMFVSPEDSKYLRTKWKMSIVDDGVT